MEEYHYNWLKAHPHRTEDWLRERLKEGFDIHHIDGDHSNNDPRNLVLIEHTDHMLIHSGVRFLGRLRPKKKTKKTGHPTPNINIQKRFLKELKTKDEKYLEEIREIIKAEFSSS